MKTEKEVAELARDLQEADDLTCLCECEHCEFDGADTLEYGCKGYSMAVELYRKGYRKTAPTDTALTAKEHKAFLKDLLTAHKATAERVRKETAEAVIAEILEALIANNVEYTQYSDYAYTIETIKEIAKRYGVEVEG